MWATLRRDWWFRAVLAVGAASVVPSFVPLLPRPWVETYNVSYSDALMILMVLAAVRADLGRADAIERRFWDLLSCGLFLFLLVQSLVFLPQWLPGAYGFLARDVLFLGLYVSFAVALELRPHLSNGLRFLQALHTAGAIMLGVGLLAYFILIPGSLRSPASTTSIPSLLLYTAFDGYLVIRLGWLLTATKHPRWRATWLLLLATAVSWLVSDAVETLRWAGFIAPTTLGRLLDVLWLPPFLGIAGAARLRNWAGAWDGVAGAARSGHVTQNVSGGPLWLQAAVLPILHVVLDSAGVLDPVAKPAQQIGAFLVFLAIGPLALLHQRRIELQNESLEAERARVLLAEQRAHRDALTGLPNRYLLLDHLTLAISQAKRAGRGVGVLFLDLDRFKLVNDSLGHAAGDRLLCAVAERLQADLRTSDTLARVGGDEFVVVAPGLLEEGDAGLVAHKLLNTLRPPFQVGGSQLFVTASVGATLYPNHGTAPDSLLKSADLAMYRAKDLGRDGVQIFDATMAAGAAERLGLDTELHRAEQRGEFELHYQPVIELAARRVCGFEALLRWRHPERGLLSPSAFLEVADSAGIVARITPWLLRTACADAKTWQGRGHGGLRVSVNLSARQFLDPDLVRHVGEALVAADLEGSLLELEITETVAMRNPGRAAQELRALKRLGLRVSIDDFGTGYSSLAYLKAFPIDSMKIDRSFVRDIHIDPADAAIAATVTAMARTLGLDVVAEGVELDEQLLVLAAQGCHRAQGHLFGPAVPGPEIPALLAAAMGPAAAAEGPGQPLR